MQTDEMVTQVVRVAPGALLRLDADSPSICVLEGLAWITFSGRDVIAGAGRTVSPGSIATPVLVSGP